MSHLSVACGHSSSLVSNDLSGRMFARQTRVPAHDTRAGTREVVKIVAYEAAAPAACAALIRGSMNSARMNC